MNILDNNFINSYKDTQTPFSNYGLGEFVYKRTYSRQKENGEYEKWHETIGRVINGIYNIKYNHYKENNIEWNNDEELQEAINMYKLMFNVKFLPGGRSLWAMGTSITDKKKIYAALNNCAAVTTENIDKEYSKPFEFLFDLCMLGTGVGFDTRGENKIIINKPLNEIKVHYIEDSREGWVKALHKLLNSYFKKNKKTVQFDYSLIRPLGSRLNSFGGTASGPEPLKKSFKMISNILDNNINKPITSKIIVDIMNIICLCVISGNVRRSASIAVGRYDDEEFLKLKNYNIYPERCEYSWLSNNSVIGKIGQNYVSITKEIPICGEPGILWIDNMRKYSRMNGIIDNKDENVVITNPCGEISLESYELCNLVEIFINRHTDYDDFINTLTYAYKYAKYVSLCKTHWEETNKIIEKNRRLGISLTGITNFIENNNIDIFNQWTTSGYDYIKDYDVFYSNKLKVNKSIKLTCVKPSGTISLLVPDTNPGIHYPINRYYIRRVRINNNHKNLINSYKQKGYKVESSLTEPNTSIINFVIDNHSKRTIDDVSMWEQLELAAKLQEWWADNQVSCTISFDPIKESKDIIHALNLYQYRLKGISFLPKMEEIKLPQMPYEKISEEEYNNLIRDIDETKNIIVDNNIHEDELFCTSENCDLKTYRKYFCKNIIFLSGITGSGKSYYSYKLKEFLNSINYTSEIISKDGFRFNNKGYIYDETREKEIKYKYLNKVVEVLKSKIKFIILDNTHLNDDFIDETLEYIKNNHISNIKYIKICFEPYSNVEKHRMTNIHNLPIDKINIQYDIYINNINKSKYKFIKLPRYNNNTISIDDINKSFKEIMTFFNV